MAKKSHKNKKKKNKGSAAPKAGADSAASKGTEVAAGSPAAAPLGSGRVVKKKVPKPSMKERAAMAKMEARAKWAARMTAEGR